ncbi:MAG: matrixin family metalloprotease [Acidobacteria bacterium]|nr:matrixin family metalloprotease [Acidobacteriota bacterium]
MGVKKKLIRAFQEIAEVRPTGKGRSNKELKRVQDFLCRFGYLKKRGFKAGTLDKKTSEALSHYQRAHGRRVTGDFNKATRDQMTTSRCGFPDMNKGIEFSTTCAWDKTDLTFTFDVGTNDVAGQQEFDAVRSAFQSWAAVTPLTFREVGLGDAPDISIGWRPANDPDLDMRGGTLAHADFPPACSVVTNSLPKPVHFDDTEHQWVIGRRPGGFDIETVALHEIGHILGLAHSNVAGSVMFPSVSSNLTKRSLTADDISGIQNLYPPVAAPTTKELLLQRLDTIEGELAEVRNLVATLP